MIIYDVRSNATQRTNKIKPYLFGVIVGAFIVGTTPLTAIATGNTESGVSVGTCISHFLYGNEPHMSDGTPGGPSDQEPGTQAGNVSPTQAPGPFTDNADDPENPFGGSSVGHLRQDGLNYPELCKTVQSD